MVGQARFTYTDEDLVATQLAGWRGYASWRNLLIAYAGAIACNGALFTGLNIGYGTQTIPADWAFVFLASAVEAVLIYGLLLWGAGNHGRQVLRSKLRWAWDGSELVGEHAWAWGGDALHMRNERGRADLPWTSVGAWLDAPKVLLLYPSGSRAFRLSDRALAAEWQNAPKLLVFPFGGHVVPLPKRALAAGDAGRLVDVLREAGVPERRRFGLISAKGVGTR